MKKEAGLILAGLAVAGMLATRPDQYIMDADDYSFREQVLSSYPYTVEAVQHHQATPFFSRHTTLNGGGHFKDEIPFKRVEIYSEQDEAAVHEMSHSWFDHMTRKDETFGDRFMAAAVKVAMADKPYGYYHHLLFGYPGQERGPIALNNYTETYASISSFNMGQDFPEPLQEYYKYEFYVGD